MHGDDRRQVRHRLGAVAGAGEDPRQERHAGRSGYLAHHRRDAFLVGHLPAHDERPIERRNDSGVEGFGDSETEGGVKSAAERKADERARMRARGFVLRQFWIHPKDWERVQRYLLRVNKRRDPL